MKKLSTLNSGFSISRGFTIVELLVVISLLSFVGVVVGGILFSALRGTTKSNTLTIVRQNGDYASTQMSKMIRNAKYFEGVSTDDSTYVSNCVLPTVLPGTPTPTLTQYSYTKITSFDGAKTTFACCSSPSMISSSSASPACDSANRAPLLDTTSVSVSNCSFTCSQNSNSDYPTININFSLSKSGTNNLAENTASIPFQTSVTLRNVGR